MTIFKNPDHKVRNYYEATRITILGLRIPDVPVRSVSSGGCADRRQTDRKVSFHAAQVGYFYGHRHRVDDMLLVFKDQL